MSLVNVEKLKLHVKVWEVLMWGTLENKILLWIYKPSAFVSTIQADVWDHIDNWVNILKLHVIEITWWIRKPLLSLYHVHVSPSWSLISAFFLIMCQWWKQFWHHFHVHGIFNWLCKELITSSTLSCRSIIKF